MGLFDRHGKLRNVLRNGKLHTTPKEILPFLRGRLSRSDLPELVVEPSDAGELCSVIEFAAEKRMRVAIASGLKPVDVHNLEHHLLILTTRLAGTPVLSASHGMVHVAGGLPLESLSVDLARAGQRWLPLWPIPSGTSIGELFALGWEGLRSWRDGGVLCHIRTVNWVGFDGTMYQTGPVTISENTPDVSGLVFGSRGEYGVITSLELELRPTPEAHSAVLLELPDVQAAVQVMIELQSLDPEPETVVYWGEVATQILREGNDFRVSPRAVVLLTVEWREELAELPQRLAQFGDLLSDKAAIDSMWQDLFRFPRTTARLYPERTGMRLRMPAMGLSDLEDAARDLGRESNLPVALWGTLETGHLQVWALQPDSQPRTVQHAEELLKKIYEIAIELGGSCAPGALLPFDSRLIESKLDDSPMEPIHRRMKEKCDPHGLYSPLTGT